MAIAIVATLKNYDWLIDCYAEPAVSSQWLL